MYYPTLQQITKYIAREEADGRRATGRAPIIREVLADLETPVSAFIKLARPRLTVGAGLPEDYAFLLESVEGGERLARYSFIGIHPFLTLRLNDYTATTHGNEQRSHPFTDPLATIAGYIQQNWPDGIVAADALMSDVETRFFGQDRPAFLGGAVGFLGYEMARYFETLPTPDAAPAGLADLPEAALMFVDQVVIFDHLKHKLIVVGHVSLASDDLGAAYADATRKIDDLVARLEAPLPQTAGRTISLADPNTKPTKPADVSANRTQADFLAAVEVAKEHIRAGDIYQVQIGQRLSRPTTATPFNIYRALRAINPSPYMYYLHLPECDIVGASPEMLVRVENGKAETHPIAGTRRRGLSQAEDEALARELLADEKERAEHVMLIDLGRNDIGRIATPGTVRVTQVMDIERYSHVMHIVSHVEGQLNVADGLTAMDALASNFPAGTVTGAPKIRAMQIIAELEPDKRGVYAGAFGYFDYAGNLNTAIAIRTLVYKDGVAHVQASAGIVADSVPQNEYQETINKAMASLRALDAAEQLG